MDSRTLGMLGGGWRARLLVLAAHKLGVRTFVLDPGAVPTQINALASSD